MWFQCLMVNGKLNRSKKSCCDQEEVNEKVTESARGIKIISVENEFWDIVTNE